MPEPSGPPSTTSPDLPWLWQGYLGFIERELLGLEPPGQTARFAQDWQLPPGLRPIAGGDIFGDVNRLVNSVVQWIGEAIGSTFDAFRSLIRLPDSIFSAIDQTFFSAVRDVVSWLRDAATGVWRIVYDAPGWAYQAGVQVAGALWSPLNALAGQIASALTWLGGQLWSALSAVAGPIASALTWLGGQLWSGVTWAADKVWSGVTWAANLVWSGLTWAADKVWSGVTWAANLVWSGITWAAGKVYDAVTWLGNQAWSGLQWATEHVWDGLKPAATWLWDTFGSLDERNSEQIGSFVSGLLHPVRSQDEFMRLLQQGALTRSPAGRFLFGLLVTAALLISVPQTLATVYTMGIHQDAAAEVGAALMSQAQIRDAHLRGIDTGIEAAAQLRRYGFDASKVGAIIALWDALPTPTDLVRFGVREVFTPAIAERFGQFEDFPPDFARWMARLGFSDFWARNYWAAHWELPSVTQGFEMLHRAVVERPDLDLLLRAHDVMPFWRDKLVQIAYNPITRIDLRRMFRAGSLSEAEVRRGYLDLGYSPDSADRIVAWLKTEVAGVSKDLPSSVLLRAYGKGLLSAPEASADLEDLGFDADAVELLLSLQDFALEEELAGLEEDVVLHDYRAGTVDARAATASLISLGVPAARAELLVRKATLVKAPRTAALSASQVQRALREGLIPEADARARLFALAYNERDTELLVRLAAPEPAPPEVRELSVAQLQDAARRRLLDGRRAIADHLDQVVARGLAETDTLAALHDRLTARAYTDDDAWLLVALTFRLPSAAGAAA